MELTFNAQDADGNVWNLGEYPEEYENGHLTGAPNTWIPGVQGAKAGLLMRADPRTKTSRYLQGYSPRIDFLDCAKVFQTHQRVCARTAIRTFSLPTRIARSLRRTVTSASSTRQGSAMCKLPL